MSECYRYVRMMDANKKRFAEILRKSGFRVTKARLGVLNILHAQKHPVGIEVLASALPKVNQTTLYRIMHDFTKKGIVHECDLGHGHADYEIADRPHHHHAICESCGKIEEIYGCNNTCDMRENLLASSKEFAELKTQNTSVYGTCRACAS